MAEVTLDALGGRLEEAIKNGMDAAKNDAETAKIELSQKIQEIKEASDGQLEVLKKEVSEGAIKLQEATNKFVAEQKKTVELSEKLDKLEVKLSRNGGNFASLNGEEIQDSQEIIEYLAMQLSDGPNNKHDNMEMQQAYYKDYANIVYNKLSPWERGRIQLSLQTDDYTHGGVLTSTRVASEVIKRLHIISEMRPIANVVTATGSNSYRQLKFDTFTSARWANESNPVTTSDESRPGAIDIMRQDVEAVANISRRMEETAVIDLPSAILQQVVDEFAYLEGAAFVNGDGVSEPRGFLTYDTYDDATESYQSDKIGTRFTDTSGVLSPDDVITFIVGGNLPVQYRKNRKLVMHPDIWGKVSSFKGTDGQFVFERDLMAMGQSGNMSIRGIPVILMNDMPNTIGSGVKVFAMADWSRAYTIVDFAGLFVLRNPYKDNFFIQWQISKGVGGAVTANQAIKFLTIKA